jgi:parallel beta-helix repeat protein
MWLSDVSDNWIMGNTIAYNELLGIELADSPNNTFYHNNFIHNGLPPLAPTTKHIVIRNSVCRWNSSDSSGGNLWSDYPGIDMDADGYGDTAYIIDPDNQDKTPLISPAVWDYTTPVPIVWNATIYPITITSNSTISALRLNQPEMQLLLNATHLEGTNGYSNVTVPKSLLDGNPWTVSVDGQAPTYSSITHNATHSFLYFTYIHASPNQVTLQGRSVIPEPLLLWLPILFAITIILLATTLWKSGVS